MANYYSTINGVIMTFSDIRRNSNDFETITIRFERAADSGFDFSEWKLPCIATIKSFGFSEDELMEQERYLRNNSPLIWEIAKEKEAHIA